ncbi:MAG: hypothetical protein Q8N65_02535 [bacterium]|nr:hypothetical protein [bacterium]
MKYKNTLQKGRVRYIVFKEGDKWYAVALEFNIIEAGDDPREVLLYLFEAIRGYVKSVIKIKARPQVLNQRADEEYEKLWDRLQEKKGVPLSKYLPPVYTFGERTLAVV